MKYLVIWFVLTSAFGNESGVQDWHFYPPIQVEYDKDLYHWVYQNYKIVDSFDEAEKIAKEKKKFDSLVYIYELGKQYEVKKTPYKVQETHEVTKYNYTIEQKEK